MSNGVFSDGYDHQLMGDEHDRQRLATMTELQREKELFNRAEQREVAQKHFELRQKVIYIHFPVLQHHTYLIFFLLL